MVIEKTRHVKPLYKSEVSPCTTTPNVATNDRCLFFPRAKILAPDDERETSKRRRETDLSRCILTLFPSPCSLSTRTLFGISETPPGNRAKRLFHAMATTLPCRIFEKKKMCRTLSLSLLGWLVLISRDCSRYMYFFGRIYDLIRSAIGWVFILSGSSTLPWIQNLDRFCGWRWACCPLFFRQVCFGLGQFCVRS